MDSSAQLEYPQISPVKSDKIPQLLKDQKQWINWNAGPLKPNGKFDKIPISPTRHQKINPHDGRNWLTFDAALSAHIEGGADGIGFVMSTDRTIRMNGTDYYLIALDFDGAVAALDTHNEIWMNLGKPYAEVSPSGNGLRMFALTKQPLKNGNDGNGHEIYCHKQFLTVTGFSGRGTIRDATSTLTDLHKQWFPNKGAESGDNWTSNLPSSNWPETSANVAELQDALSFVSSDTDYMTWRNIVWAILSTGWDCAEDIAREWSRKAERRYNDHAFDQLVHSFDPTRGISVRTIFYHAKQAGWTSGYISKSEPDFDGIVAPTQKRLLTATQVLAMPVQPSRVKGLLPAEGLAAIYGESGSGKSFLAMDLSFSIAAGFPEWFGLKVKPSAVAYIALEGQGGIKRRLQAWELHHARSIPDNVRFILKDFTLLDTAGVKSLAVEVTETVGRNAVIIVDTLSQSAPGAEENGSQDMSKVISNAKLLAEGVQGLVILIHHSGKDATKGMRGHSSLYAAMDAVIEVKKDSSGKRWSATKVKDGSVDGTHDFELVSYTVDADADGDPITSCAVRRTINIATPKLPPVKGKNQVAVMNRLRSELGSGSAHLSWNDAAKKAADALSCPAGRRNAVAKETLEGLIARGYLQLHEGVISFPKT